MDELKSGKISAWQHKSRNGWKLWAEKKRDTLYENERKKVTGDRWTKWTSSAADINPLIKTIAEREVKKEKDEDAVKNGSRERLRDSSAKVEGKSVEVLMGNRRREWQEVTGRRHKYRIRAAMDEMRGEVRRRGSCFSMELLMISTW